MLRLRGGRIVTPTESVLLRGPVAEFFADATGEFIRNACELSGSTKTPPRRRAGDGLHMAFVESVLLYTAELHHGGTLLFVPEEITHEDARLKGRCPSSTCCRARGRGTLVSAMAARLRHNAAAERLEGRETVKGERLEELEGLAFEQQNCEDAARRRPVHCLAHRRGWGGGADRHVPDHRLRRGGDGRTSPAPTRSTSPRIQKGGQSKEAASRMYGTRHRSAFRFVGAWSRRVAFVMSQDGGVKRCGRSGRGCSCGRTSRSASPRRCRDWPGFFVWRGILPGGGRRMRRWRRGIPLLLPKGGAR